MCIRPVAAAGFIDPGLYPVNLFHVALKADVCGIFGQFKGIRANAAADIVSSILRRMKVCVAAPAHK